LAITVEVGCPPTRVDAHVAAIGPAQFRESLPEGCYADLSFRIVRGQVREHPDAPHSLALLRARRERPRGCRAPEQRDEFAAFHCYFFPLLPTGR
jgi:hypothetical protein